MTAMPHETPINPVLIASITLACEDRDGRPISGGREIRFRCPAHQPDAHPSARWNAEHGVWHCDACQAGGGAYQLADLLGVDRDRWPDRSPERPYPRPGPVRLRPVADESSPVKPAPGPGPGQNVAVYPYGDGRRVLRYEPKTFRPEHLVGGQWRRGKGPDPWPLYRQDELPDDRTGAVHVTEGEKDADTLAGVGWVAVSPGSSTTPWQESWTAALAGRSVVIHADNDGPGRKRADEIARLLIDQVASVRIADYSDLLAGGDVSDFLAANDADALAARINGLTPFDASVEDGTGEPWPPLIPIKGPPPPAFPADALGPAIAPMVHATARATQTPEDLAAIVCLGTISTAVRGRFVVQPRPGWTETLVLFLLSLLESGNRKSTVFALLTQPLMAYEQDHAKADRQELARWESRRRSQEKDLAKLEATDETKTPDARHRADALAMELAADRKPAITRLVVDDVTAEKLSRDLHEQGGALGIMSPEGGIFANLGGKYNGGIPALDVFLKGHAGDTIRVGRIGREGEFIARPALTLCISAQPTVADDLRDIPGFRGRGLAARILASFPVSPLGYRDVDPDPTPDELSAQWAGLIASILALEASHHVDPDGTRLPHVLAFSRDADTALTTFRRSVEVQLRPDGALSEIKDWGGKLPGAVVRIAGLLHVAQHAAVGPEQHPVSGDTVRRAIVIADYFAHHARQFFTRLSGRDHLGDARDVLAAIGRLAGDGEEVSRSALLQALRGQNRFATTADLTEPLSVLQDFGHLRLEERPRTAINPATGKAAGGRPPIWIVLRPVQHHPKNPNNSVDGTDEEVVRVFRTPSATIETPAGETDDASDVESDDWEVF